jgi:ABC-type transporter Mla maintaining outer membrane lipid asymmetry permease subunit MlaE
MFDDFIGRLGKPALNIVQQIGGIGTIFVQSVYLNFRRPFKFDYIFKQMEFIGVRSILVVLITGAFTGMVLALQSSYGFSKFGANGLVGVIVTLSMTRAGACSHEYHGHRKGRFSNGGRDWNNAGDGTDRRAYRHGLESH